ncbi:MAG: transporter [Bacteroidetes bacterium]|nr:transporter [Bacteroidota bacterium]
MRLFVFTLLLTATLSAQEFTKAIEDNSFFIEEAYNQEQRVVQHITNASFLNNTNSLFDAYDLSFTQEWPAGGRTHQLSYTVPYSIVGTPGTSGIGDVMLNYRFQMVDSPARAFAPRVSVILPTGDKQRGLGSEVFGIQTNLPYSERISNTFVTHVNIGGTYSPDGIEVGSSTEDYSDIFVGGSAILLLSYRLNVMMEILYINSGSSDRRTDEMIVSPGMRFAIDIGGVQIVPGLAFPYSSSTHETTKGMFLYISTEHSF